MKRSYWASESDEELQAALTEYVKKRDALNGELDECIDSLRDELFTRTQERYADQRAHDVFWMTSAEVEAQNHLMAGLAPLQEMADAEGWEA